MKHQHLIRLVSDHPLAILPAKLDQIEAFLQFRIGCGPAPTFEAVARPSMTVGGGTAIVPVFGVLSKRMGMIEEMSGGSSTESIGARFREAMADPNVGSVVLQIDSPGGSVYGVQELATEIFNARGQGKRIVAVADALAASAAYWIGSAADEFVVTPSGEVGSIGVVSMHVDYSEALANEGIKVTYIHAGDHKVEGNAYEPLGDDTKSFMQQRVDEYYDAFLGAVAKYRGVKRSQVSSSFGQGRVYGADQAKSVGMVDRIATFSDVVRGLQPRATAAKRTAAQAFLVAAEASDHLAT